MRLAMAGVDMRTVAQFMRHATIQMTTRCARLAAEREWLAIDRLAWSVENWHPANEVNGKRSG
jgi:hypothetical protein